MKFHPGFAAALLGFTCSIARGEETPPPAIPESGTGRWQICAAAAGVSYDGKPGNRSENTILLDTKTGKSWILWPTKDTPSGYSWIELTQRSDSPEKTGAP